MSSTGSHAEVEADEQVARRSVWPLLLAGVGVLACALVVATQTFGVLYGILIPPDAPVFANMRQLAHTNLAHGVDEWRYATLRPVDEVVAFYTAQDATCASAYNNLYQPVTRCDGREDFSIFTMRWQAVITAPLNGQGETLVDLSREVFWLGSGPQPTPVATLNSPQSAP